MQHEREEVHGHRGAQDQPHAAGLHQEPIRLHTGCPWQLKRAEHGRGGGRKTVTADMKRGRDDDDDDDDDSLLIHF